MGVERADRLSDSLSFTAKHTLMAEANALSMDRVVLEMDCCMLSSPSRSSTARRCCSCSTAWGGPAPSDS